MSAQFGEWLPIETAPKDGTSVLTYRPTKPVAAIEAMEWNDYGDNCGDWCWSYDGDTPSAIPPTHWRPLPPPPKTTD